MIYLIGAGGFLGSLLAQSFLDYGKTVCCVSRSYQWTPSNSIHCITSSLETLSSSLSIEQSSDIIYMAGSSNLFAAEKDPVGDLRFHSYQLNSFLELISSFSSNINSISFISSAGTVYGEYICLLLKSFCPQVRLRIKKYSPRIHLSEFSALSSIPCTVLRVSIRLVLISGVSTVSVWCKH